MKLDINDLTSSLAKSGKVPEIKPIDPSVDFMSGFVQNVKQVMDVLDTVGIKDLFVEKAREELQGRLFGRRVQNNVTSMPNTSKPIPKEKSMKFDIEKGINLALLWLDKFIERNGDMPLTQFRKEVESQKDHIVKLIKSLGIS